MQARLLVRRAAARLGILPGVFGTYRWVREFTPAQLIANGRARRRERPSGVPIPPARLRYLATTTREIPAFLEGGRASAESLRNALERVGSPFESMRDVLDFGCGCGRVLRHWDSSASVKIHGCDYNPLCVDWITTHFPWVSAQVNQLEPPLPYADGSFDFVYAMSVFTHLPLHLQDGWMAELHRVLRPGGILAITTMGEAYAHRLSVEERNRFNTGEIIVHDSSLAGTNLCAVFHPEQFVRRNPGRGFEVADFKPNCAPPYVAQDLYLLRRHS